MSRATIIQSLSIAVTLFIGVNPASAEPAKFGRLSDGRAYRVDANGYQLIDQVAELEVANDELRKQVATLEAELDGKDKLMDHVGGQRSGEAGVPDCNDLVSGLYLKISKLQSQLKQGPGLPAAQVCDYQSAQNPLWAQIRDLESRVEPKSGGQPRQCDYDADENPFRQQVRQLQTEARERGEEIERMQTALAELKSGGSSEPSVQRARLSAPATGKADRSSASPERRELQQALKNIEGLILTRKSAYDQLKGQATAVSVSISPLRTSTGISLDTLRSRIQNLGQHSDPDELRQGLAEIEKILQDDVAVMQRLLKL